MSFRDMRFRDMRFRAMRFWAMRFRAMQAGVVKISAIGWLCIALVVAGCGTGAVRYPMQPGQVAKPQPPVALTEDRPLVVLAFSGGGSRAAALAAAVVKRLDRLHYAATTGPRRLSDDIAVVSSVSGGSVYAAHLGLHGPGQAERFLARVRDFDGIGWLTARALNPLTWLSLALEDTTRVAVLQDMIEVLLETNATLPAFDQPVPRLILLNAADIVGGEVFTFDRTSLEDICMDYETVPVSLGVTASAAYPIGFTPVLLANDSYQEGGCAADRTRSRTYRTPMQVASGPYANLEAYRLARYRQALRNDRVPTAEGDLPPRRAPAYLRLSDGGVADNSGLTALRRALLQPGAPADLGALASAGKLRRLVVIVVNARSDPQDSLESSPAYTSVLTQATRIAGTLVDNASGGAAGVFQAFIRQLEDDRDRLVRANGPEARFAIFPITIDFDQMPTARAAEREAQQRVKSIKTSWTLEPGDVEALDRAAGLLLWRHPCFRDLVADMGLAGLDAEAPTVPGARCPIARPPIARPTAASVAGRNPA
jgi:NTE family protein